MGFFFEKIQQKFTEHNIPNDVAENFISNYRLTEMGVLPEITLSALPPDECFETLKLYCDSVGKPDALLVCKLLQIPYSRIQATKQRLAAIDLSFLAEFDCNHDLFFVKPEQVDKLQSVFENRGIAKEDYLGCFLSALVLGDAAVERVDGVYSLLDVDTAKWIVSNASVWYAYSDPVGLIECMLAHGLNNRQIGDLLIADPLLVMQFRQEGSRSPRYGHNQEYIDRVLSKCIATSQTEDS